MLSTSRFLVLAMAVMASTACTSVGEDDEDEDIDLSIVDATLHSTTGTYIEDQTYYLTFSIENDSEYDISDLPYEVRVDGVTVNEGEIDIDAGDTSIEQSVAITFGYAASTCAVLVIVDPDDLIDEEQEGNNSASMVITVQSDSSSGIMGDS